MAIQMNNQDEQERFDERKEWGRFVAAWGYLTPSQQRQLAATAEGFKFENESRGRGKLPAG